MEKTKKDYVETLQIGSRIAFKIFAKDAKLISGDVIKIGNDKIEVETKNGKKYFVPKENIAWVNTNGRWPKGILECLKGIPDSECIEHEERVH